MGERIARAFRVHDEEGFTTFGMAIALLLVLSLLFSAAQVYRINAASAEIQEVADASALAALNDVSEYVTAVRICDALTLSMTLLGATVYGVGAVALCVPGAAHVSGKLLEFGKTIFEAREKFVKKAAAGLNAVQKALPFLAAASAASVASANRTGASGSGYYAAAVLVPFEGKEITVAENAAVKELDEAVQEEADDLEEAARRAEEAAKEALAAKKRAFEADCGNNPGRCMYERAKHLAKLDAGSNPLFTSVDTWSFSVALERARDYYRARYQRESTSSGSVSERANSVIRKRFYAYAVDELKKGYVKESEGFFDAYLPMLPKNLDELRSTSLYSEAAYPVTSSGEAKTMHAWTGCPRAAGYTHFGSVAQLEQGDYETCPSCEFTASSVGSVAAATTSVSSGFEFHYRIVAQAARDYEAARAQADPYMEEAKGLVSGFLEGCRKVADMAKTSRFEAEPPGCQGCIAMVVSTGGMAVDSGFESSFVRSGYTLGARAAVSGATLIEDDSGEGHTVITSILDEFEQDGGFVGAGKLVLQGWSKLLDVYADGQKALVEGVESMLSGIPLVSASGLGEWAGEKLRGVLSDLGLEPADTDILKPVLLNTAHVAASDGGSFAVQFSGIQQRALQFSFPSTDLFGSLAFHAETSALDAIAGLEEGVVIAEVELPLIGEAIPVKLMVPPSLIQSASDIVRSCFDEVRSLVGSITTKRVWQ